MKKAKRNTKQLKASEPANIPTHVLNTCAPGVIHAAKWLQKQMSKWDWRSNNPFSVADITYALYKVYPSAAEPFLKELRSDHTWDVYDLFDDPHLLYYALDMGAKRTKHLVEAVDTLIREEQTVRGRIHSNSLTHVGPMRVLIRFDPEGAATKLAINYFVENLEGRWDLDELCIGALALHEVDANRFRKAIVTLTKRIKGIVGSKGLAKDISGAKPGARATAIVSSALARLCGPDDVVVKNGISWLQKQQRSDGSWDGNWATAQATIALVSAGRGPRQAIEVMEVKRVELEQRFAASRPVIVLTDPLHSIFSLKERMRELIYSAQRRLWICSRFVSEFWTDLVSISRDRPGLDIRLITIPKRDAKSAYVGSGKKFLDSASDVLQKTLKGNYRESTLLHARAVVSDDTVLISTADLTSEQLDKEFNAGIVTADAECVADFVLAFERIWKTLNQPSESASREEERT